MKEGKYVVRLWDMFDGWIDLIVPSSYDDAYDYWLLQTAGGTKNTQYSDGDYYAIFPADTKMFFTPERMDR